MSDGLSRLPRLKKKKTLMKMKSLVIDLELAFVKRLSYKANV